MAGTVEQASRAVATQLRSGGNARVRNASGLMGSRAAGKVRRGRATAKTAAAKAAAEAEKNRLAALAAAARAPAPTPNPSPYSVNVPATGAGEPKGETVYTPQPTFTPPSSPTASPKVSERAQSPVTTPQAPKKENIKTQAGRMAWKQENAR